MVDGETAVETGKGMGRSGTTGRLTGALTGLILALAAVLAAPAVADQRDPRLEDLFQRLRSTADEGEAQRIQGRIWRIWMEAQDREADELMRQGVHAMALQQLARALRSFDRLVALTPEFAEAWNKRATVHYLMGNFGASVRDIQQTLALEPRHFGALSGLGLIYDAVERPAAALRSLEAAIAINPHLEGGAQRVEELRSAIQGSRT